SHSVYCFRLSVILIILFLRRHRPPRSKLFPYTTLFRSAKYVNKKSDMDLAAKGLGAKEWNNSLKTKLSLLPKKLFHSLAPRPLEIGRAVPAGMPRPISYAVFCLKKKTKNIPMNVHIRHR